MLAKQRMRRTVGVRDTPVADDQHRFADRRDQFVHVERRGGGGGGGQHRRGSRWIAGAHRHQHGRDAANKDDRGVIHPRVKQQRSDRRRCDHRHCQQGAGAEGMTRHSFHLAQYGTVGERAGVCRALPAIDVCGRAWHGKWVTNE